MILRCSCSTRNCFLSRSRKSMMHASPEFEKHARLGGGGHIHALNRFKAQRAAWCYISVSSQYRSEDMTLRNSSIRLAGSPSPKPEVGAPCPVAAVSRVPGEAGDTLWAKSWWSFSAAMPFRYHWGTSYHTLKLPGTLGRLRSTYDEWMAAGWEDPVGHWTSPAQESQGFGNQCKSLSDTGPPHYKSIHKSASVGGEGKSECERGRKAQTLLYVMSTFHKAFCYHGDEHGINT